MTAPSASSDRTKLVLVLREDLPLNQAVNAAVVLGTSAAGLVSGEVGPVGADATGHVFAGITTIPVPVLVATSAELTGLHRRSVDGDPAVTTIAFTEVARRARTYADYLAALATTANAADHLVAVLLHGPVSAVNRWTRRLALLPSGTLPPAPSPAAGGHQLRAAQSSSTDGVRAAYDAVADAYDRHLSGELLTKPLDRALLRTLVELVGPGPIADVGCGPGHVSQFLAGQHPEVVGVDLSPAMISIARERVPGMVFTVASMLELPVADAAWSGIVALYSVIHLSPEERATAFNEFARALRSGGWLLVSFHVDSADFATGDTNHLTTWFGQEVELYGHFLDPDEVAAELVAAGFVLHARVERQPNPAGEYPSRRCYLLAHTVRYGTVDPW